METKAGQLSGVLLNSNDLCAFCRRAFEVEGMNGEIWADQSESEHVADTKQDSGGEHASMKVMISNRMFIIYLCLCME